MTQPQAVPSSSYNAAMYLRKGQCPQEEASARGATTPPTSDKTDSVVFTVAQRWMLGGSRGQWVHLSGLRCSCMERGHGEQQSDLGWLGVQGPSKEGKKGWGGGAGSGLPNPCSSESHSEPEAWRILQRTALGSHGRAAGIGHGAKSSRTFQPGSWEILRAGECDSLGCM